jgi:hypothetical protein
MSPAVHRLRVLVAVSLAAGCAGCGSDAGGAADALTYFEGSVPAKFAKCGEPTCKEQVGKATWSLKRTKLVGNTGYRVPGLGSTNAKADAGPMIFLAGAEAAVAPGKARDVALVAAGTVVEEYSSADVPCVSRGTCRTTAALVDGKLVSSTYTICYEAAGLDRDGSRYAQSIDPAVIGKAREHQDGRLPRLANERTIEHTEPGFGWDFAAQTHVRYDGKMLVGVNANGTYAHGQFDDASVTGCVNTFVVMRSPMTELLFKKFETARKADEDLTVPR